MGLFDFFGKANEKKKREELLREAFETNKKYIAKNDLCFAEYIDDEQYGLIPTMPIYTNMPKGSYEYLERLKTETGRNLIFNRIHAVWIEGINGAVDAYEAILFTGEKYGTIYLNMYSSQRPTKAPKGYIYKI